MQEDIAQLRHELDQLRARNRQAETDKAHFLSTQSLPMIKRWWITSQYK